MTRKSLEHYNCSWAQAAEAVGDKWSMMIIRDAFFGVRTFSAFQKDIGIAKNILTQRLEHLQKHDIIQKRSIGVGSSRSEYCLTEKGLALFPVIVALGQWGDKWVFGKGREPFVVVDREKRKPVKTVRVLDSENKELRMNDVTFKAGKGANERNREVVAEIELKEMEA